MPKVFIIAEAGVNHNGSLLLAKQMIDAAVKAGADAIKFQTFRAQALVSKTAPKAAYQKKTTGSAETQFQMIKKLELDAKAHEELIRYCALRKIIFLSSPFDLESIDLLARLKLKILKVPSGEINNLPYLRKVGSLRKKVFLSTGMSNTQEIKEALEVLIKSGTPKKDIVVLHCNTQYPTPFKDANLWAMITIKNALKVNVGYSDHTLGIEAVLASVALGAQVVEKHFTLDKSMSGPDHQASVSPEELTKMVESIRHIELAMGTGIKRVSPSELANIKVARKSIIAAVAIKKGEYFTDQNLTVKRPGGGISPMKWDDVIGRVAKKNFVEDEMIKV